MNSKTLALVLCLMLATSTFLIGCGGNKDATSKDQEETTVASEIEEEQEEPDEEIEPEVVEEPEPQSPVIPTTPLTEIYKSYITDGDFTDFAQCGEALGVDSIHEATKGGFILYNVNGWSITITTNAAEEDVKASVIAVGEAMPKELEMQCQRVLIVEDSGTALQVFENGETIDLAVLDFLPAVMYYCQNNPYPGDLSNVDLVDGFLWENYDALGKIWDMG